MPARLGQVWRGSLVGGQKARSAGMSSGPSDKAIVAIGELRASPPKP